MNLDYKKTYKIELLNEFANSVYAKVVNLAIQQDLTPADENHFLIKLIEQFEEMLNIDLFKQSMAELDDLMSYWQNMKNYAENLETSSSVA